MNIKSLVENPHPVYSRYVNFWSFTLDAYEGGIDYTRADVYQQHNNSGIIDTIKVNGKKLESAANSNLFRHKKERSDNYVERIRMSYYYNFCAPIIDIYTNHLFALPIVTDWGNIEKAVDIRKDNVDRCGSSITEFRKEMAEASQIAGHSFVVVDKPQSQEAPVSLADQMDKDLFPYFTLFSPSDVLNWAVDEFGRAYWVLLREIRSGNNDPSAFNPDLSQMVQYRIWTRSEWILFNAKYEEIGRGVNPIGMVPVEPVYNKKSKKQKSFLGISELADIAFIARDVYNRCSELNEIIRNQTFAFLTVQGKSGDYNEAEVGTSLALLYPEGVNTPSYISPPPDNARVLMEQIDRQITKMFQLAKLSGGSAVQDGEVSVQSGVSKAFDFHETNSALCKKAGQLEDAEQRIWRLFAKWEGQSDWEGSIIYPRDYNVKDLNADLEEAEKLMKIQLGEEFNTRMKKEIIKKKFPRATDEEVDEMEEQARAKETSDSPAMTLRSRLPGLFNNNALPGGKNGGM